MKKFIISSLIALALGITGVMSFSQPTHAANAADFDPGYIIDDYVFYNSGAMDSNQIQNFLTSKNPNCDYWGTQSASDWGYPNLTHAQFTEKLRSGEIRISGVDGSKFHAPPYRCLTMYTQNTPQMEGASGYCGPMSAGSRTAAQIINDVAKACGINPQVLIVLLEKEQSLVTDKWPLNRQLQNATGFACPDTAPCDPAYEGLFYQIYYAARQFKVYQAHPNSYNYRAGRTNNIYWNPDLSRCGSSQVYIQNQATAGLYVYTPYRPNQAALNNLYGTGDSCSSYGNRNFWRMFTDWFGSTKANYIPFETPRWMVLTKDQIRIAPGSNAPYSDPNNNTLPAGTQLKFVDKIWADGQWYYRTEYNSTLGANVAIPAASVGEIPYETFETPRWMQLKNSSQKRTLAERPFGPTHLKETRVFFVDKIYLNGTWYYRTKLDSAQNNSYGFPSYDIQEVEFSQFDTPRYMMVKNDTSRFDAIEDKNYSTVLKGTTLRFSRKITLGNQQFFQTEADEGTGFSIPSSAISEVPYSSIPDTSSKWLVLNKDSKKLQPSSSSIDQSHTFPKGLQIEFKDSVTISGKTFFRTKYDYDHNTDLAFSSEDISEIDFIPLDTPRKFRLTTDTAKVYPKTGMSYSVTHAKGTEIFITSKILINNTWYFRSEFDTNAGTELAIPAYLLAELH